MSHDPTPEMMLQVADFFDRHEPDEIEERLTDAAVEAADALLVVSELGYKKLDGREKDAIALVRHICHEIEDGDR